MEKTDTVIDLRMDNGYSTTYPGNYDFKLTDCGKVLILDENDKVQAIYGGELEWVRRMVRG